jgi:hypothetical protein
MGASAEDADCSSRREHPTRDRKDDDAKPDRNVAERGAISKPVEAVCKPCVNLVLELVVGMPTIVLSGPGIRRLARGADSLRHNVPLRLLRQASGPLFGADIPQFRERRVKLPSKLVIFEAIRLIPPRSIEEACEAFASASPCSPRRGNKRGSRRSHLEGCDSLRGWPCSPFRSPIGSKPENL